jgi:hypothetical protein
MLFFLFVLSFLLVKFSLFDYLDLDNFNIYLYIKYFSVLYFYNISYLLVDYSYLYKISLILFSTSWFETLFIGLILILALLYIIYIFKK